MPFKSGTELAAMLREAGIDPATAEAVLDIDGLMQKWRRRAMRRELGHRALVDLKVGIDLAQFDVLAAIEGPSLDAGESQGETMIATVAERLNIDPSRASRLVSEMVEQGFAQRAVSQADARRTVIVLTERARAVVGAVQAYKFLIMGDFLSEWDPAELAAFVPLLKRFGSWMDGIDPAMEKHAAEIAALAESIAQQGTQSEPA
ncbi:MarR family winged helix-turn-helix transcriptional regulator [Devosia salina]|uniref:MarR family winged helix-turn-helix transcriptional regulator n=1 Tax=Devosia salina TaxID=2860336 RepID=A0ABX8WKP0_9HYPH|nr:MarR family winged helix-turn-helix transcriptional regulator [Devosia salina]QYO78107.1 MarR family winged helix-turn-helix transcriptional regulator [Devosia salina]